MMHRPLALPCFLFLLLLAGCAVAPRSGTEPAGVVPPARTEPSYEAAPGRDAATVAQMRASAAPAAPILETGEESRLLAQGYVRIGTGRYPMDEAPARDAALRQGQQVGAERVLLHVARADQPQAWIADFYVRFKLPFGAAFRDTNAQERRQLGRDGGVQIGSVISGTPASRANLLAGDFVLELDGKPIADRAAFQGMLRNSTGRTVTLTVVRNGETLKRMVRLGAMPTGEH